MASKAQYTDLLTVREVAEMFGVSQRSVRTHLNAFPHMKTIGGPRFPKEMIEQIKEYMFRHGTTLQETTIALDIPVAERERQPQSA